ncbi:MAG: hypothetical protein ACTHW2_12320 [Tissierella sp.]|uniref:hypothetical protein n=1 Tax=Tissierella sp. TaxID=41274 RepID=UPI003F962B9A
MDIVMIGLLLLAAFSLVNLINSQKARMKYMNGKLDAIMKHLDIEDNTLDEKLIEFIEMGESVAAVKILRQRTGMDLKEAKEYVDRLGAK